VKAQGKKFSLSISRSAESKFGKEVFSLHLFLARMSPLKFPPFRTFVTRSEILSIPLNVFLMLHWQAF